MTNPIGLLRASSGRSGRSRLGGLLLSLGLVFGVGATISVEAAPVLAPRVAIDKSKARFPLSDKASYERIVVKFKEGSGVSLTRKGLVAVSKLPAAPTWATDLAEIDRRVKNEGLQLKKLFTRYDADKLSSIKQAAEARSGKQLADLNLYFELPVPPDLDKAELANWIAFLNKKDSVEIAYASPKPEPATLKAPLSVTPASSTPLFQSQQGYLNAAPSGVDALYAWTVPGGRGREVKIADVEGGWRFTHEDMPLLKPLGGGIDDPSWINHGTAVVGVMGARDNTYGVTGIVSDAEFSASAIGSQVSVPDAILAAGTEVGRGGVILIELHAPGPEDATPCTCNHGQCNYLPMEYWPAEFDAIQTLTARGVTVVEAGGNGSVNLDDPVYNNLFNRQVRDSGAILVGASVSYARTPACFTNAGSRIDAHGWGDSVTTMGYGGLDNGRGEDGWYTAGFSGTSSATPIVAGAVASVQGVALNRKGDYLSPAAVRDLIKQTGTPQSAELNTPIGPLPNLKAAIDSIPLVKKETLTLSGSVFVDGVPNGAASISGSGASCTTNQSNATYSCVVPWGWSGTLSPSRSGYSFAPASRSYASVQADRTGQDYQMSVAGSRLRISGAVSHNGAPLHNVFISAYSDVGTATCNNSGLDGRYSCSVSPGWGGTLVASIAGYTFTPASRAYAAVASDQADQNFTTYVPNRSATIYYKKGFSTPYIHYRPTGGNWTTAPGVAMLDVIEHCGYAVQTIDLGANASTAEVAFNNGAGSWDSNGGRNYLFGEGASTFAAGVISAGPPLVGACSSDQAVTFKITANTVWGENIYLIGNSAELGNWDVAKAVKLSANAYPTWEATILFPVSKTVEYKYLKKGANGSVVWESGANRVLTTSGSGPLTRDDGSFR